MIEELEAELKVDRFNLDEELVQHPQLFWKVSEAAVLARSRVDKLKADLDRLEAVLDQKYREEAILMDTKITERGVSMSVERDPERLALQSEYLDRKFRAERLDALKDAFRARAYVLRDLVELHIAGYYSGDSIVHSAAGRAVEAKADRIRERLTAKRRLREPLRMGE